MIISSKGSNQTSLSVRLLLLPFVEMNKNFSSATTVCQRSMTAVRNILIETQLSVLDILLADHTAAIGTILSSVCLSVRL